MSTCRDLACGLSETWKAAAALALKVAIFSGTESLARLHSLLGYETSRGS